jgi:hypothetical protein
MTNGLDGQRRVDHFIHGVQDLKRGESDEYEDDGRYGGPNDLDDGALYQKFVVILIDKGS